MEQITSFKICPDYNREQFDFDEIQRDRKNPLDRFGIPLYPVLISSNQGSSFTYKISDEWFFKRKLQDGGHVLEILSQHHYSQNYNELSGSLDDLGEVISYNLASNMIDPQTGKPLVSVCEYHLATYCDKEGIKQRGCISKNLCTNPNDKLVSMAEMLTYLAMPTAKDLDTYMLALKRYCKAKNYKCDFEKSRQTLIKNSYFCWKIANSDNHKNNITFLLHKNQDGSYSLEVSPMIDNGSAYELSAPFISGGLNSGESRLESILNDEQFSTVDENGNRVFSFPYYPHMHSAFQLNPENLLIDDLVIDGKHFTYEYGLACEMLEDPELFRQIFEIEKQFDIAGAIDKIDQEYGTDIRKPKKMIDWPPLLKEMMFATNEVKSRTLGIMLADYYTYAAYSQCIKPVDRNNANDEVYNTIRAAMVAYPLQPSKTAYDELFVQIATSLGLTVDTEKLKTITFKKQAEMKKPEVQPQ